MKPRSYGDLQVFAEADHPLDPAFEIIGRKLHPTIDKHPRFTPGTSKRSCILTSLTLRDFLTGIGFEAEVQACRVWIGAFDDDGTKTRDLVIGDPNAEDDPAGWNAHMVVHCAGLVVDPTVYQIRRPEWHSLPGMVALPLVEGRDDLITMLESADERARIVWLPFEADTEEHYSWESVPDARPEIRDRAVHKLKVAYRNR